MNESISFDTILENKIKYGKYQLIGMAFLCLVDFNDGVELITMSLILPIIKKEWGLSYIWIQCLSSIFYLGMLIGAMTTGNIADYYGRRYAIIFSSAFQFLIALLFSLANNLFFLLILRFLYGFCYGFSLPLSISMVSEIIPLKYRGKSIVITNFFVSIGKVWGIIIAAIILENLNTGNWRLLMIISSFSSDFIRIVFK